MKSLALTMPDDPLELRHWLDGMVARGEAARLADELGAVHGAAPTESPTLTRELAATVRQRGFAGLSVTQCQDVLRNGGLLVALAEDVLVNGGEFWSQRIGEETAFDRRVEQGKQRLDRELFPVTPRRERSAVTPWATSLAVAAALMVAFYLSQRDREPTAPGSVAAPKSMQPPRWGWQRADELASIAQPADYLDRIADLADEWGNQDTATTAALADRIAEFRHGCSRLQLMDHKPLDDAQRMALLTRCQKWAKKFDQSLIDLETGADPAKVRDDMTATVAQLTTTLRGEAAKIRAG